MNRLNRAEFKQVKEFISMNFRRSLFNKTAAKRQDVTRVADVGPTVSNPPPIFQDMPPKGGYAPIRFRRNMPNKMWKSSSIIFVMAAIMAFGWYQYYYNYIRKKQIDHERYVFTELAVNPFLQAEKDIMYDNANLMFFLTLILSKFFL